jgi:1,4-dihydroxy-2-naphthoyl-CoA hydrolase
VSPGLLNLVRESFHFSSTSENQTNHSKRKLSIEEFLNVTFWNDRSKGTFAGVLGMEILSMSHGHVSCQLKIRDDLLAPTGYLHAGVVVTLADTACGYGCMHAKPSGAKLFTTIELKSNFIGTVKPPSVITCVARLLHAGKKTQVWDAEVKDLEKNKLLAMFRCTQLILY